ncbi:hypothetical protein CMI41_00985 [Candidatus Pacearchaeota archaeon]|nr:hypothetical protein [Candidatus Pacearchaeota archaeon]|tara:strand:+ start:13173 stop:13400 length:228 start_codon:yes stop_codon:yes gene_type:complete
MDYKLNKTQQDLVKDDTSYPPEQTTIKVAVPGIKNLHLKSSEEIALTLSNIMRSQSNVTEIRYVLGQYIELVVQD